MPRPKMYEERLQILVSKKIAETLLKHLKEEEETLSEYIRTLIKRDLKEKGVL